MSKLANRTIKILLFVTFCVICTYEVFYSTRSISCDIDSSFSWQAYSYTPITDKVIYNYAFPADEISITLENRKSILQMITSSKIKRRLPGSWNPYGWNARIPCVLVLKIENNETKYTIFLCKDSLTEFLLLRFETYDTDEWYNLESPELLQYLNTLFPYDNIGNKVTHIVGTNN